MRDLPICGSAARRVHQASAAHNRNLYLARGRFVLTRCHSASQSSFLPSAGPAAPHHACVHLTPIYTRSILLCLCLSLNLFLAHKIYIHPSVQCLMLLVCPLSCFLPHSHVVCTQAAQLCNHQTAMLTSLYTEARSGAAISSRMSACNSHNLPSDNCVKREEERGAHLCLEIDRQIEKNYRQANRKERRSWGRRQGKRGQYRRGNTPLTFGETKQISEKTNIGAAEGNEWERQGRTALLHFRESFSSRLKSIRDPFKTFQKLLGQPLKRKPRVVFQGE